MFGHLVDDLREQLPAHVGRRLELLVGARAGRAQQIAAVGRLEIEADRRRLRRCAPGARGSRSSGADRPARAWSAPPLRLPDRAAETRPLPTASFRGPLRAAAPRAETPARDRSRRAGGRTARVECSARMRARGSSRTTSPSNSSARSSLSASASSTSYHGGRTCTSMPISSARCSVCRITCSVLQEMSSKKPRCGSLMPSR